MPIQSLEITDFRNLRSVKILPSSAVNWFIGQNGSGKTSVLEALYLLSTGRSFRSLNAKQFINHDSSVCLVVISMESSHRTALPTHIGVERDVQGGFVARSNGVSIKRLSELARLFPVVTLLPESVNLLTGDPSNRREFVDWTMFHVEHGSDYFEVYRRFTTALQNRNKLLRNHNIQREGIHNVSFLRELDSWDEQFAQWGERLSVLREEFLEKFCTGLYTNAVDYRDAFGSPSYELERVKLVYSRGWAGGRSLADQLQQVREKDIERGTSTCGPQRFDFKVQYDEVLVRDFFSRGQLRHLTSLCKISQARLFQQTHVEGEVIFLFDDAFAELDSRHALSIISVVRSLGLQMFVTSVEAPETKGFSSDKHDKMFHVEHGSIGPLSVPNLREHI